MSLIKKPNEIVDTPIIKMCIYGQPGIGKTTLALSSAKPLLFDFDRGINRVESRYRSDVAQPENYTELLKILDTEDLSPYDSIVFDTLGKLIDLIGNHIRPSGALRIQDWGSIKIEFQRVVSKIQALNKNFIVVAHEKTESVEIDGKQVQKKSIDVSGSSGKDIIKELDLLGYVQQIGDKRTICFTPNENFYAKNSIGLKGIIAIPDIENKNTFFTDVILPAKTGRIANEQMERERYNDIISELKKVIDTVTTPEEADAALEEINNTIPLWNSLFVAKAELNKKITTLGLTYDAKAKKFVEKAPAKATEMPEAKQSEAKEPVNA